MKLHSEGSEAVLIRPATPHLVSAWARAAALLNAQPPWTRLLEGIHPHMAVKTVPSRPGPEPKFLAASEVDLGQGIAYTNEGALLGKWGEGGWGTDTEVQL